VGIEELYKRLEREAGEAAEYAGRRIVPGEGCADAPRVVFVGEAPGAEEDRAGRPFVGAAGRNLDIMLELLGRKRVDVYITNLVKARPAKVHAVTGRVSNRPPTRGEVEFFLPYLREELALLAPEYVVTLGNFALAALTGGAKAAIGTAHGTIVRAEHVLFPLYHPAAAIYNRKLASVMREDVLKLRDVLEGIV